MGIQGIAEALDWAFRKGAQDSERCHYIEELRRESSRRGQELEDLKPKFLKLAEDFQNVIKENETIRAAAEEQAVALTTEVETLKEKLAALEAERNHPPMEAPKPT